MITFWSFLFLFWIQLLMSAHGEASRWRYPSCPSLGSLACYQSLCIGLSCTGPFLQFCLPQSLGNGVALGEGEGGPRSALLWTLLRGSTTEPHPDILPPIRLIWVVMKIFWLNSHSITWDGRSVSGKRPWRRGLVMVLGLVLVDQPGLPQPLDQLPKEDDQGHDGGGGDQSEGRDHVLQAHRLELTTTRTVNLIKENWGNSRR